MPGIVRWVIVSSLMKTSLGQVVGLEKACNQKYPARVH